MCPDYIDLHCDTAYELYHQKQSLGSNALAVSLDGAAAYSRYAQFFAIWSDKRLDDEAAWQDFLAISDHFTIQIAQNGSRIAHARTADELEQSWRVGKNAALLAVEDARILNGRLDRLDELARRGVTYLTLTWKGESCIGGAYDTEAGLTDFGREVVLGCFERGIIPDISHASAKTADEVLTLAEAAGKPIIATHSNAYGVYPYPRNLRDEHAKRLFALGGIVGLNLCAYHVRDCEQRYACCEDMLAHIEHFLSLGGENRIAIGGDLDGASLLKDIRTVDDVARLADVMASHGYTDALMRQIFSQNALDFIKKNLGGTAVR